MRPKPLLCLLLAAPCLASGEVFFYDDPGSGGEDRTLGVSISPSPSAEPMAG